MGWEQRPRSRYSPEAQAEFQRLLEETKTRHNISDLVGRWTSLKKAGPREMVGICVFHSERTPSLRVNDTLGTYHCFGCGASGDTVKFIQDKLGIGFMDALRWLGASDLPVIDASERARRREAETAERLQAVADARAFFADAGDVCGTAGERYLRARGITSMPAPHGTVRFGYIPAWQNEQTKEWGRTRPALVCGCQDVSGTFVGIQRVFVDGPRPDKATCKLTLGRMRGGAIRLGPVRAEIVMAEGPEDGLSLAQELPNKSVWVACGTGLLPFVEFPPEVDSVVIAGQNDAAGRAAVETASEAYLRRGLAVCATYPEPEFGDWNDQLRGRH